MEGGMKEVGREGGGNGCACVRQGKARAKSHIFGYPLTLFGGGGGSEGRSPVPTLNQGLRNAGEGRGCISLRDAVPRVLL